MPRYDAKIHLIGSIPLKTVEEVFTVCSSEIGDDIKCIPDGEVGDRADYNTFVAYRVLDPHPELETLEKPRMAEGKQEWWHANDLMENTWKIKIRDDVKIPRFDNLLYADAAIESYQTFKKMKAGGLVPSHIRFQVSLPPPHSAAGMWFHDPGDYDRAVPAYLEAMVKEVGRITDAIPNDDLAIQWDACHETLDIEGNLAWTPKSDPWVRFATEILPISMYIPEEVLLGYHFCYGDIQGQHEMDPKSLNACVRMANLVANNSGRRIDWVHMPVPEYRTDDDYFRPLESLNVGETRVVLGLVQIKDGIEGAKRRIDAGKKFLTDFAIAAPCGLGRHCGPEQLGGLLRIHHGAAQLL